MTGFYIIASVVAFVVAAHYHFDFDFSFGPRKEDKSKPEPLRLMAPEFPARDYDVD